MGMTDDVRAMREAGYVAGRALTTRRSGTTFCVQRIGRSENVWDGVTARELPGCCRDMRNAREVLGAAA